MGNYTPLQEQLAEDEGIKPRYPVFIPSKGRYQFDRALTARWLARDGVPFFLVVEPKEADEYLKLECVPAERVLVMPRDEMRLVGARNWIKDYSAERGDERHWQLDDNTYGFYRYWKNKRVPCRAGIALRVCEDFTDRYENIAVSGLNYDMFDVRPPGPVVFNCHVYSCTLVLNSMPYRWRLLYNDDTDLCLQVLAGGWCTALLNAFCVKKKWTMTVKGGNTTDLYQGDGRLRMARMLEREWPGVVETKRRFQRPQHVVKGVWSYFDTQPRLRPGIDLANMPKTDDYGMELKSVAPIKSERIQGMLDDWQKKSGNLP